MKKGTAFMSLVIVILVMVGFGYIMMNGIDEKRSGAVEETKLGLDLAGGVSITYEIVGDTKPSQEDVEDTIMKLRKRIDKYSTESDIYQAGDNRISIEIPGVTDAEAILEELGSPGALYFIRATAPDGSLNFDYLRSESGELVRDEDGSPMYTLTRPIEEIVADGSAVLNGLDVVSSKASTYSDQKSGVTEHIVSLSFTDEGAKIFSNETAAAAPYSGDDMRGRIAIYYDGELISVPNVQARIDGGRAQISGMKDHEEAEKLAQDIRIGGLKLELKELCSNVVGAQLGGEAIEKSIKAGIIGLIVVIIFMIAIYRVPGVASSIALVIYTMMMLLCINFLEITLTLPGIAGIILSIGMAVDANVIIFARIREEIAAGISVESSIKTGFEKALSAILDGNITTLIAAIVLIVMGSGTIKGFAYTLALGIVLSMITALFVTKLILNCFFALGFKKEGFYGKAKEIKKVNFVGKKKIFFSLSAVIIVVGIVTMGIFGATTGDPLNFGLEFKGGAATSVDFEKPMDSAVIDSEIVPKIETIVGDANVQWTSVNDTYQIIFKTKTIDNDTREQLKTMFSSDYGVNQAKIEVESISSTISGEMQKEAIIAVIVASICMLIYIWFRFSDFRFGTSAVAALIHDVLVVVTFYALFRIGVGSSFIACMLTIVGYSINATIVIFDRIRENIKSMSKKETLEDVVNKSISQTLTRSVFTSLTTFIMVLFLYILGVSSIKEFALPLMIGIISGTYSSICVTGPLWWVLRDKFPQVEEDDD